jgi:DNA modification methylase
VRALVQCRSGRSEATGVRHCQTALNRAAQFPCFGRAFRVAPHRRVPRWGGWTQPSLIKVEPFFANQTLTRSAVPRAIRPNRISARRFALHPRGYAILPRFFIELLTHPGDLVIDPFVGSCTTGYVAESLDRIWLCIDQVEEYLKGGMLRFSNENIALKAC